MGWVLDRAHSSVDFAVKHMVISSVKGHFAKFDVDANFDETNPEGSNVFVRIDAASIDTKESQRDGHLRSADFLKTEEFPSITFRSKRVERAGADRQYKMVGDLTIRGVTREVALDTTFAGIAKDPFGKAHAGFTVETAISRKDYGLEWNMALETGGWLVGDNVKIGIEVELIRE